MHTRRFSQWFAAATIALSLLSTFARLAPVTVSAKIVFQGQQLITKPYKTTGIYALGDKVGWSIDLPKGPAGMTPSGDYVYTIKKNNLDVIQTGKLDLSTGHTTIETTLQEPAMIYVQISPSDKQGKEIALGAAVARKNYSRLLLARLILIVSGNRRSKCSSRFQRMRS